MGIRPDGYIMIDNEIISVQFRGDHLIIEALTETRLIPIKELDKGTIDHLQGQLLGIWDMERKRRKYYTPNKDMDWLGLDGFIREFLVGYPTFFMPFCLHSSPSAPWQDDKTSQNHPFFPTIPHFMVNTSTKNIL